MAVTYSVKQVAELLGYSTNSIYTFLKEKRIKGVRVGKGRFRIPESEVQRLTGGKKSITSIEQMSQTPVMVAQPVSMVAENILTDAIRYTPSLFDWFVGIGSVVIGLALFLFSRNLEESAIEAYANWISPVRISLIAGGIGLIYTNIFRKESKLWHKVFHAILAGIFAVYSIILLRAGDVPGVFIYGLLAVVMAFDLLFKQIQGKVTFVIYVVIFALTVPTYYLTFKSNLMVLPPLVEWAGKSGWGGVAWLIFALTYLVLVVKAFKRGGVLVSGLLGFAAIILGVMSVRFAQNFFWGRAFFTTIMGLMLVLVPMWDELHLAHRRNRWGLVVLFGLITMLFVCVIGVVAVVQKVMVEYASGQLRDKVIYGKVMVEGSVDRARSVIANEAKDPEVLADLEEGNAEALIGHSRRLFELGNDWGRISFVNALGTVVASYPYDTRVENLDVSNRDYFKQMLATGDQVVSEVFVGAVGRPVIAIISPFAENGEIKGAIMGVLDLRLMGDRLQELGAEVSGEEFVVLDNQGRRIIYFDENLINTVIEENSSLRSALSETSRLIVSTDYHGQQILQAHERIEKLDWIIAIQAPYTSLLRLTKTATLAIFSVSMMSMVMVFLFVSSSRAYRAPPT